MSAIRLATWNLLHGIPVSSVDGAPAGSIPGLTSAPTLGSTSAGVGATDAQQWRDWVYSSFRTAVRDLSADVIALQEVDRDSPRSGFICHTCALTEAMSGHGRFCPTLRGVPGEQWQPSSGLDDPHQGAMYGIGLVSKHPVRRWHSHELPCSQRRLPLVVPGAGSPRLMWVSDEPRWALAAEIESPHGNFTAITTHLSFVPGVNLRQLRALTHWAQQLPGPVFLLGDLNLPHRIMRTQRQWRLLAAHSTYPVRKPRIQFDHIAVLQPAAATAHSTSTHALPMGDHRALSASVSLG